MEVYARRNFSLYSKKNSVKSFLFTFNDNGQLSWLVVANDEKAQT